MRNVVLYLAMSLDGYPADKNGGVDWLGGDGSDPASAGSYPAFYETVDTVVMGWNTYHHRTLPWRQSLPREEVLCFHPQRTGKHAGIFLCK